MLAKQVNQIYGKMQSLGLYQKEFATLKEATLVLELAFYPQGQLQVV